MAKKSPQTGYLNDSWTIDDDFGMGNTAHLLARVLLEAPPPFAARVVGKWGSGKTSIMRRAFATLGGCPVARAVPLGPDRTESQNSGYKDLAFDVNTNWDLIGWDLDMRNLARSSLCVWYSPWQHQDTANPLLPLLLEIKAQFSNKINRREGWKELNRKGGLAALSLLEKVADVAMTIAFQKNVNVVSGTTDKIREIWKEGDLEQLGDGQRFHLLFEDAVSMALETVTEIEKEAEKTKAKKEKLEDVTNQRLIIFIDDLDRCEEHVAINLLECIKLYLHTHNCVFVFGLDDTALLEILARQWPKRPPGANREYLEKLFQMSVAVPTPSTTKVKDTLQKQLAVHLHNGQEALSQKCAEQMIALIEPNPRKIKNFANSYCAALNLARPHLDEDINPLMQLMICQYLRQYHGPIWRLIEREPGLFQLLDQVLGKLPVPLSDDPISESSLPLVRKMMERHFAHVLDQTKDDDEEKYGSMNMDLAVTHIIDRIDQKRSDTELRQMMARYCPDGFVLPDYLLGCVDPKENP